MMGGCSSNEHNIVGPGRNKISGNQRPFPAQNKPASLPADNFGKTEYPQYPQYSQDPPEYNNTVKENNVHVMQRQNTIKKDNDDCTKKIPVITTTDSNDNEDLMSANRNGSIVKNQPINDFVLNRFIEIQAEIEEYERKGVFDGLRIAEEEFEALEKMNRQAEIKNKVLTEQTKKEKQDFDNITQPTVQSFFRNKEAYEAHITKEQQEYFESLNLLEISNNELKSIQKQYENSKEKLEKYKKENQKAIELFNEQMNILYATFDGDYGSELENQLEREVNALTEKKDQLRAALHKWTNSKFLLVYSYNQLQYAQEQWAEMMKIEINNPEKVINATEVRNNLVAANQNLINTRSYLKNIQLPYCTEEDLKTLQNLAAATYQDMQSVQRQEYCLNIIDTLRKRCAALNQWFDQVIKDTLVVDYSKVKIDFDQKSKQLKMERIRLLKEKIKEKTGKDVQLNFLDNSHNANNNCDKNDKINLENIINSPFKTNEIQPSSSPNEIHERPISCNELPPPPTRDQILGNIETIKKQYVQQVNDWNNHLDNTKREADEKLNKMLNLYDKK